VTLISIAEARARVLDAVSPLGRESVAVEDALGRVLTGELRAAGDVPPFPSSAMDGYAIHAGAGGRILTVTGEARAGAPSPLTVGEGDAIRISTGAAVPAGATAVIRQEDTIRTDDRVEVTAATQDGGNIRGPGEDMARGVLVLDAGTVLGAAELGAAVAAGVGRVEVAVRPAARVFCTGDELRAPGEPLRPGEIHNSNAPMLAALAERSGAMTLGADRLLDDRAATEAALARAFDDTQVLIVTGGVSVGPHDHVKPALAALEVDERFWGVALQPGKPTWFGTRGKTLVFGLPGNPVSAVVTFSLFVAPAVSAMLGASFRPAADRQALLTATVRRNRDREQAVRVRVDHRDGATYATPNGAQGSHMLTSLIGADALAMIPAGDGELAAGAPVALEPLLN
jgi:molybdopterin molybdotransferase